MIVSRPRTGRDQVPASGYTPALAGRLYCTGQSKLEERGSRSTLGCPTPGKHLPRAQCVEGGILFYVAAFCMSEVFTGPWSPLTREAMGKETGQQSRSPGSGVAMDDTLGKTCI